jgi:hypothetical protein
MKFHHSTILAALWVQLSSSCDRPQEVPSFPARPDTADLEAAYALCSDYGDVGAAGSLAYQLATAMPADAVKWKEELAKIHFATQRHASCLKILEDLTTQHGLSDKLPLLEMMALCHEALGQRSTGIAAWKKVWEKSRSALYAVRLAGLQSETDSLDEAEATMTEGLAASDSKTATLPLPKSREEFQQIPAAAALHNLKALLLMKRDPGAKEAVRAELQAALALAPDFELALRNRRGVDGPTSAAPISPGDLVPAGGGSTSGG